MSNAYHFFRQTKLTLNRLLHPSLLRIVSKRLPYFCFQQTLILAILLVTFNMPYGQIVIEQWRNTDCKVNINVNLYNSKCTTNVYMSQHWSLIDLGLILYAKGIGRSQRCLSVGPYEFNFAQECKTLDPGFPAIAALHSQCPLVI